MIQASSGIWLFFESWIIDVGRFAGVMVRERHEAIDYVVRFRDYRGSSGNSILGVADLHQDFRAGIAVSGVSWLWRWCFGRLWWSILGSWLAEKQLERLDMD